MYDIKDQREFRNVVLELLERLVVAQETIAQQSQTREIPKEPEKKDVVQPQAKGVKPIGKDVKDSSKASDEKEKSSSKGDTRKDK